MSIANEINSFLISNLNNAGKIDCEQSLQVELGIYFRSKGYNVSFERKFLVPRINTSIKRPKSRLDIFVEKEKHRCAIELKVPLNGRHPETLFDYCKDIEFVEAILSKNLADEGLCMLLTNDHVFWEDSGRGSKIHNMFREERGIVTGLVEKPTGKNKPHIYIKGSYSPKLLWKPVKSKNLLPNAKFLLIEVAK